MLMSQGEGVKIFTTSGVFTIINLKINLSTARRLLRLLTAQSFQ